MSDEKPIEQDVKRLKLLGLKALADEHTRKLADIRKAAIALTGENDDWGLTADWISDDTDPRSVDDLLALID